jgi:serine/threonine protein kinase
VVKVFERGEDHGRLWYAMEFCRGRSLRTAIGTEGLPPERALTVLRQLLEAVRAIHAAGVIHRDLKPDNVFLVPNGNAKGASSEEAERVRVLDFGLARLADARTRTSLGFPAGTLPYLPPEYLGSGGREDAAVDRYALGVILYEMLTGSPPFADAGDDPASMLFTLLHEEPVPPAEIDPRIPAGLSNLALWMIARNPADRPGSVEEIDAALQSVSESVSGLLSQSPIEALDDSGSDCEKR